MSVSLDLILAGGSAICALQYALGLRGEEWGRCVLLWDGNEGVECDVERSVEGSARGNNKRF
jgi:hypothetical protein